MREAKYTVSGNRLTEQMKLKDVRAAELAVDTGISPGLISQYKSGKVCPSKERAELLGSVLGCSGAWLLGYDVLQDESPAENVFTIERKRVPLLGAIACGELTYRVGGRRLFRATFRLNPVVFPAFPGRASAHVGMLCATYGGNMQHGCNTRRRFTWRYLRLYHHFQIQAI